MPKLGACPRYRFVQCSFDQCHDRNIKLPGTCAADYIDSLTDEIELMVLGENGKPRIELRQEKEILAEDAKNENYVIRGVEDHIAVLNSWDFPVYDSHNRSTSLRKLLGDREIVPLRFDGYEDGGNWDVRGSELLNDCVIGRIIATVPDELLNKYFRDKGLNIRTRDVISAAGDVLHKVCLTQPAEDFTHKRTLKSLKTIEKPLNRWEYSEKTLCYKVNVEGFQINVGGHPDAVAIADDILVVLDLKRGRVWRKRYPLQLLCYAQGVAMGLGFDVDGMNYIVVDALHRGFDEDKRDWPRYEILFHTDGFGEVNHEIMRSHQKKMELIRSAERFGIYKKTNEETGLCEECYSTQRAICNHFGYGIVDFLEMET